MANCSAKSGNINHDLFLAELKNRVIFLPIKSTSGNDCISIDMRCCSEKFFMRTDEFLERNSEFVNLLVTGEEYYLEVLNFSIFTNVWKHKYRDCSNS